MSPELLEKCVNLLTKHEGWNPYMYFDTSHPPVATLGYGHNLIERPISANSGRAILQDDINYFYERLVEELDFFKSLDEVRQLVIIDMCFNLGLKGFLGFEKTIEFIRTQQYTNAAVEMLESQWAQTVGQRAKELANMMRTGELI